MIGDFNTLPPVNKPRLPPSTPSSPRTSDFLLCDVQRVRIKHFYILFVFFLAPVFGQTKTSWSKSNGYKRAVGECLSISKTGSYRIIQNKFIVWLLDRIYLGCGKQCWVSTSKASGPAPEKEKQRKIKEATPDLSKKLDPITEKAPFPWKMVGNVGRILETLKLVAPHDSVKMRDVQ